MAGKLELTIPRGLNVRALKDGDRIQIAFSFDGQECRELLPIAKINKTFIDYAAGLRAEIRRKISEGTFVYSEYFPESSKAIKNPVIRPLTLGDLLVRQLATYENQVQNEALSSSTLLGYAKAINNQLIPKFKSVQLSDLTPVMLRDWITGLDVTAKTVRNILTPLRSVLDDAVNDELLASNPLDKIALKKLLKQTSKKSSYEVDPFDMDEVAALIKGCRSDERNMVQFWIETGLRPGELIALAWPTVDFIHNCVRIEANEVTGMAGGRVARFSKSPKTEAGKRNIELSALAMGALAAQKSVSFLEGGRIWLNPRTGQSWGSDAQLRKTLWEPLCKRAGVRYRNPYQVRHTFASTRLTAGANPFWLANQMGHVDGEMVFKIYGKWIPQNYQKGTGFAPISHQSDKTALGTA